MLDQSSIISICSAAGTVIVVVYTTIITSKINIQNLKEAMSEFKKDIKEDILNQKKDAMKLAGQKFCTIEDDIKEIFPRLRKTEEISRENSLCIDFIKKEIQKQ